MSVFAHKGPPCELRSGYTWGGWGLVVMDDPNSCDPNHKMIVASVFDLEMANVITRLLQAAGYRSPESFPHIAESRRACEAHMRKKAEALAEAKRQRDMRAMG